MEDQNLKLNHLAVAALRESAKWCMFLAIVGFISIAFMLIVGVFMSLMMPSISDAFYEGNTRMNPFNAVKGFLGIFYIILAVIYFFPVYYLLNYAKGMKQALETGNEQILSDAFVNLKSHHKFLGIFTIVMLAVYALAIIGFIIFAASIASRGM